MSLTQRGFTLVEMLVALSVAALLLTLVYGAVRIGQRSVTAAGDSLEHAEVMRIGWHFIHDAIARARPVRLEQDEANPVGFSGSRDSLSFVADLPALAGPGGLTLIHVGTEQTPTGRQLVVQRQQLDRNAVGSAEPIVQQAVLVDAVDELAFAYFGSQERLGEASWHDDWASQTTLPNLVRLEVSPDDGRPWPMLIAAPAAGAGLLEDSPFSENSAEPNE